MPSQTEMLETEGMQANAPRRGQVPGCSKDPLHALKSGTMHFSHFCPVEIALPACTCFLSGSKKEAPTL